MQLSKEQLESLKNCGSAQEIIDKAKESGFELAAEDAEKLFESLEFAELKDEDLEVSGAGPAFPGNPMAANTCFFCGGSTLQLGSMGSSRCVTGLGSGGAQPVQLPICDSCFSTYFGVQSFKGYKLYW